MKVLYLSYTGMTEALGQSQVLTYLSELVKLGHEIDVVSFEKPAFYIQNQPFITRCCSAHGLHWHPKKYHSRPVVLSTLWDLLVLGKAAIQLHRWKKFEIVHCRGYLCAIIGRYMQRRFGCRFIFDMRGFWADEKLESGAWRPVSFRPVYRFFKRKEQLFFKTADKTVSLTHAGKAEITRRDWAPAEKVGVVPTCVNFDYFPAFSQEVRTTVRAELAIPRAAKVLLYSGSLGGNYDPRTLFRVFRTFYNSFPNSYFLILSRYNSEGIKRLAENAGIDIARIRVRSVPFRQVHRYLMVGDIGLIFYNRGYSNLGRSPTKLGEYWACGLPVLSLNNVGDVELIFRKYKKNGIIVESLNDIELNAAFAALYNDADRQQMRADAYDYFSLERGVTFYHHLYGNL